LLVSPAQGLTNAGFKVTAVQGTAISTTSTSGFAAALAAAASADLIVFAGGIDDSIEAEAMDRTTIAWPGNQLQLIGELGALGKPLVVLQMGGGQVDSSSLKANSTVNALIWGGYPGQSGGTALANIITGVTAPAGRLPLTQYPADYINEVLMTNMALRPSSSSPGRTYKWYTGTPVFEFRAGLHYTNFSLSWAAAPPTSFNIAKVVAAAQAEGGFIDLAVLHNFTLKVANTGAVASDYVALLFSNTTAGPQPAPLRELVSFTRVKDVQPGQSASAVLTVTLGQIARADENGNSVLYPGTYELWVDTTAKVKASFTLTGKQTQIVAFPQPS